MNETFFVSNMNFEMYGGMSTNADDAVRYT